MVVQGDVPRTIVQVYGSHYHMRGARVIGQQRKQRVVVALGIVKGLVVYNKTRPCCRSK